MLPEHCFADLLYGPDPERSAARSRACDSLGCAGPQIAWSSLDEEAGIAACEGIIDLLSVFFNVSGRQLRSSRRTALPVSRVRQIGMYIAHVTLGMKMAIVGAGFGRDKSTVVHACHTVEDLRDDEDFDMIVARVERLVTVAFSLDAGREKADD